MKKIVYTLLLILTVSLGVQNIKAEEKLTCIYGENIKFEVSESAADASYAIKGSNAIFKEISANNFKRTVSGKLSLSCPQAIYMRQVPHLQDPSMPIYISFDIEALEGSNYQIVNLDTNKSSANISLGNIDDSNFKECIYKSDGVDNGIDVFIKYYNGQVTADAGSFPVNSTLDATDFENDGKLICPDYNVYCTHVDYSGLKQCNVVKADSKHPSSDKNEPLSGDQIANGKYLTYLGELKVALQQSSNYNKIKNISIDLGDNNTTTLNEIDGIYGKNFLCATVDCGGQEYIENAITTGTRNIVSYCNDIYGNYAKNKFQYSRAMKECSGFGNFYKEMANNGVISNDLSSDCPLLSRDMVDKLQWVLNIFRIVAPIAAIGLGTIDFIKVIASGDADKEMKNAGKRLLYRLIAAVLLLIIPTILAFLLDVFLGNNDGYNSDNPFCNIVEWKE